MDKFVVEMSAGINGLRQVRSSGVLMGPQKYAFHVQVDEVVIASEIGSHTIPCGERQRMSM